MLNNNISIDIIMVGKNVFIYFVKFLKGDYGHSY